MAVEKVYKCDLCGEYAGKDTVRTVRVGDRGMRVEDYVPVDVCGACEARPIGSLAAHVAASERTVYA